MSTQNPDITDEEIGLRSFRIRRERAVERAVERVRQGLGTQWATLSVQDVHALEWMFGELWSHVGRDQWDRIPFSALHFAGVARILDITSEVVDHKRTAGPAIDEVYELVKGEG